MSAILIEEDLITKYKVIDKDLPEGKVINDFLLSRAKALAGKYIDFDKNPVTFVLSKSEEPNALFAPISEIQNKPKLRRRHDEREDNIVYTFNPYETPVICVTQGLIDMIENVDELDYVLGHELTHLILRGYGIGKNSKGEETLADLHAIDLVYDAGGDPKQALAIADKINKYHTDKKNNDDNWRNAQEEGLEWSDILNVHMTHSNRRSALEASLTRISHLIDARKPSIFDKSVFTAQYSDPIDEILNKSDYHNQAPLDQLKILIDAIETLSVDAPPRELVKEQMESIDRYIHEGFVSQEEQKLRGFYEHQRSAELENYYSGKVMEAKYKQKIAQLSEAVFSDYYRKQREELKKNLGDQYDDSKYYRNEIEEPDTSTLSIYLQDKAYQHVKKYGYPNLRDVNYHESTALLYTYFYNFLESKVPDDKRMEREGKPAETLPQILTDIISSKQKIHSAKTTEEFTKAYKKFSYLYQSLVDIRSLNHDYRGSAPKMDNISLFGDNHHYQFSNTHGVKNLYQDKDKKAGEIAPWNNLIALAKTDDEAKNLVQAVIKDNGIEDYRLTHDLPYVKMGDSCYTVNDDGILSEESIPKYELNFALNRDDVLAAYRYIKTYFEQENAYFNEICEQATKTSKGNDSDIITDRSNLHSYNTEWADALMYAFNSLPSKDQDREYENKDVLRTIPYSYKLKNQIPGVNEDRRFILNEELFEYKNPIFQEYFGVDFKEKIHKRKNASQQKFFDTSFEVIKNASLAWFETEGKIKYLKRCYSKFENTKTDSKLSKQDIEKEEKEKLESDIKYYNKKEQNFAAVVRTYTNSIFQKNQGITRFTSDQKTTIAQYIVKDEHGIFGRLLGDTQYKAFCNYLGILTEQMVQITETGNHTLTPQMQIVANNIGYKTTNNRQDLERFSNRIKKKGEYASYLHAFDLVRYLSQSSEIDILKLTKSLGAIKQDHSGSHNKNQRYEAYKSFISNDGALKSITNAVSFKDNYKNFNFDDNIAVIDGLVKFRNQMDLVLHMEEKPDWREKLRWDYSSSKAQKFIKRTKHTLADFFNAAVVNLNITSLIPMEDRIRSRNADFLSGLDSTIKNLLRESQKQILAMDKPLQKMERLYWFYKDESVYNDSLEKRTNFLSLISEEDKSLEHILELSNTSSFWPEDALDHIKAFLFAKKTFIDDIVFENDLLNQIFDKVEALPTGKYKNECLYLLLDRDMRAPYPETRQRLFDIYTKDFFEKMGMDDGSKTYQKRLSVYLKALEGGHFEREYDRDRPKDHHDFISDEMASADKYILLRQISDKILSQENTSEMFKKSCQINLSSGNLQRSYLYGIGLDALTSDLDKDQETANKFIKFLNSNGENQECEIISAHMKENIQKRKHAEDLRPEKIQSLMKETQPERCKALYDNFWAAPLEARAVIIARMLKSAVVERDSDKNHSWERVFNVVMETIIKPDDESVEARYAQDIMHSYIKSRSDYERELILSAMMVANRNIGEDAGNIGKALKLFLENMGPAEIKLGQAIASHPNTPHSIRDELQDLKNAADMPARWTLYDWIKNANIPAEYWKDKYLGKILGSASYYTTIAVGEGDVLRILRPEAREKADKGFRVIGDTVSDLKEKDAVSDLDYKELTSSVQQMITQAARMSKIETDHDIGAQQCADINQTSDGVKITSGSETFHLQVMDWRAKGQNWIIMDRAKGQTFNDLHESTPQEIAYKKDFAKGYITFQIGNILSGGKFDHDTHGANLCIDTETNMVGLFDTGAMAINEPTHTEQKLLGHALYDAIKAAASGERSFTAFSSAISNKIDTLHEQGIDTQYLIEVKKGLLALGDFFNVLDKNDIQDIMPNIDMLDKISEPIREGIFEKMSIADKIQLKALSATGAFSQSNQTVSIHKGTSSPEPENVVNVNIAPAVQDKSQWFGEAFSKNNKTKGTSGKNLVIKLCA